MVLLLAFAVASIGVLPTPTKLARWLGLGTEERYPCEKSMCGCGSAHECWNNCCCNTPHQRLVWALEHGVLPPGASSITRARWMAAANDIRPGSATCDACVERIVTGLALGVALQRAEGARDQLERAQGARNEHATMSCCASHDAEAVYQAANDAADCCASRKSGDCCAKSIASASNKPPRSLPLLSPSTCKGKTPFFTTALPPSQLAGAPSYLTSGPAAQRASIPDALRGPSRTLEADSPPPRLSLAC